MRLKALILAAVLFLISGCDKANLPTGLIYNHEDTELHNCDVIQTPWLTISDGAQPASVWECEERKWQALTSQILLQRQHIDNFTGLHMEGRIFTGIEDYRQFRTWGGHNLIPGDMRNARDRIVSWAKNRLPRDYSKQDVLDVALKGHNDLEEQIKWLTILHEAAVTQWSRLEECGELYGPYGLWVELRSNEWNVEITNEAHYNIRLFFSKIQSDYWLDAYEERIPIEEWWD